MYRLVLRSLEGLLAVLEEEEGWGFSCPRRDEVRKGEEEAGEEVEEEVSCTAPPTCTPYLRECRLHSLSMGGEGGRVERATSLARDSHPILKSRSNC